MDGFVFLDKPKGMRSSEATYCVKEILGVRKAGHSGTLDPGATGLLLIGLDGGLKYMERLAGLEKEYDGIIKLHADALPEAVRETADGFVGEVVQTPPKKSTVARRERVRVVYSLDILSVRGREVRFRVRCEAGFYVRKMAHDLGARLGIKAQLWELRRTAIGPFGISMAVSLGDLERKGNQCIVSVEDVMHAVNV